MLKVSGETSAMSISGTWTHIDNVAVKCDPIQLSNESKESLKCPSESKHLEMLPYLRALCLVSSLEETLGLKSEPRACY